MPSPLSRRLDKVEAVVGVGPSGPTRVLFTVGSWADYREMRRQIDAGGWPPNFSLRPCPESVWDGTADDATRAAWAAELQRQKLAALAAAPPLPLNAPALTRYVRETSAAAVRAGLPTPNTNPFAPAAGEWEGVALDPAAHVGAVAVTEGFAAEWGREWAAYEAGEPTPNFDSHAVVSMYARVPLTLRGRL